VNQPTSCLADLSVVIPVGPGETNWATLLRDLQPLPIDAEVIIVGVDGPSAEFEQFAAATARCGTRWLQSAQGRARQMNFGASSASRSFLWFLHADSRIDSTAFEKLEAGLREFPNAIHYFDLAFHSDSPPLTRLNAWGANLRSRFLRLPYGDQGFCLSTEIFNRIGRYDESLPYGEDHILIWQAHANRIPIKPVHAQIATSARKYSRNGWLRTTCLHQWFTAKQAAPRFARLLARKGAV
jgi:rSAM/selenodomain-associated transferase 2